MKSIQKFINALTIIICFAIPAFAQNATLSGTITDTETSEPLIGVSITYNEDESAGTICEHDGTYTLQLAPGIYKLVVSYLGYVTHRETVILGVDENKVLDIVLEKSPVKLAPMIPRNTKNLPPRQSIPGASVAFIQPSLLTQSVVTSVDEVITKTPGLDIIDEQPNIRGGAGFSPGSGNKLLLLVDEMPLLAPGLGIPNWNDVPVENIEQIEITKGAASTRYGSDALNGTINVTQAYAKHDPITNFSTFYKHFATPKKDNTAWWKNDQTIITEKENGTTNTTNYSPTLFGEHKGYNLPSEIGFSGAHRRKLNKLDLVLGGFYLRSDGYNRNTYDRYGRFNIGTRYRISDHLSFGINSNFNKGTSGNFLSWENNEDGILAGDLTTLNSTDYTRFTIDPFVTFYDFSGNRHRLKGRLHKISSHTNGRSISAQMSYGEYQFRRNFDDINFKVTSGIVGIRTTLDSPELFPDLDIFRNNLASYLQLNKKIGNRFNLSAGARYEWNQFQSPEQITVTDIDTIVFEYGKVSNDKVVFRLGANILLSKFTNLRASWGQGYRYPTLTEKFISTEFGQVVILPNPTLEPETGWNTEIGLWQPWKLWKVKGFLDLALFYSEYNDMIEFGFDPKFDASITSQNVGNTRIYGTDLSILGAGKIGEVKTSMMIGFTYIIPKFKEWNDAGDDLSETEILNFPIDEQEALMNNSRSSSNENILKYRFEKTFKADIEFEYKKFTLGLSGNVYSEMVAVDKLFLFLIEGLEAFRDEHAGAFGVYGVRAGYNINDHFKISLIGNNILNNEYAIRPALLDAPMNVTLRLDAMF